MKFLKKLLITTLLLAMPFSSAAADGELLESLRNVDVYTYVSEQGATATLTYDYGSWEVWRPQPVITDLWGTTIPAPALRHRRGDSSLDLTTKHTSGFIITLHHGSDYIRRVILTKKGQAPPVAAYLDTYKQLLVVQVGPSDLLDIRVLKDGDKPEMTLLETLEPWCRRYGDRTPLGCDREITVDKINRIVTTSWNVANCPIKDEIYVEFHPRGKRGQFTYLDTPAPITVPVWRVRANAELGW